MSDTLFLANASRADIDAMLSRVTKDVVATPFQNLQHVDNLVIMGLLLDIRDALTKPEPVVTLEKLQQALARGEITKLQLDIIASSLSHTPLDSISRMKGRDE